MFVGKSAKVEYLQILLERQSTEGRDKALQQAITAYIEENGKQENKWISDGNSLIYHSIGKYQAHAPILHKNASFSSFLSIYPLTAIKGKKCHNIRLLRVVSISE